MRPKNIIMLHSVSDIPINENYTDLSITVSEFENLILYFSQKNIECGFLNEKSDVYITFDDGYVDNYTAAYPILRKYNIKATIFIPSAFIDKEGYLTSDQLLEMSNEGLISIQSHGTTHKTLDTFLSEDLKNELVNSKKQIEKITGKPVYALSYPEGKYSAEIIKEVKKEYACAVTTRTPNIYNSHKKFTLPRTGIPRGYRGNIGDFVSFINFYEILN